MKCSTINIFGANPLLNSIWVTIKTCVGKYIDTELKTSLLAHKEKEQLTVAGSSLHPIRLSKSLQKKGVPKLFKFRS